MQAENTFSCGVVIVAAGRGERAGSHAEGPKQYRRIGGRPVISHTLDLFVNWPHARRIVVVIHPDDEALFETARAQGRHEMMACISGENPGSIRFHESVGFVRVGLLPGVGKKFGRRIDLIILQKHL